MSETKDNAIWLGYTLDDMQTLHALLYQIAHPTTLYHEDPLVSARCAIAGMRDAAEAGIRILKSHLGFKPDPVLTLREDMIMERVNRKEQGE